MNAHSYVPFDPPNGAHKPGMHPGGYPLPRIPFPPLPGTPHAQPYAIPTRGAVHGTIGAVLQVHQPGNTGFGAGRGNTGGPIGGHLAHQNSQQASGGWNGVDILLSSGESKQSASYREPIIRNWINDTGLSQTFREGFSIGGMSQDFLGDDFKSQGSHVAYNIADFSTQVMTKQLRFEEGRDIYKLYHYLNHYNLFGSGYRLSAMSIIDDYLRILKA